MSDDEQPATPPPTKVDITVAGHSVTIESSDPLDTVAGKALELFRATEASARRSPVGFGTTGGSAERAEPDCEEGPGVGWKP